MRIHPQGDCGGSGVGGTGTIKARSRVRANLVIVTHVLPSLPPCPTKPNAYSSATPSKKGKLQINSTKKVTWQQVRQGWCIWKRGGYLGHECSPAEYRESLPPSSTLLYSQNNTRQATGEFFPADTKGFQEKMPTDIDTWRLPRRWLAHSLIDLHWAHYSTSFQFTLALHSWIWRYPQNTNI